MHCAVEFPVDRQIRPLVGITCSERLIDVHTEPWRFARMHRTVLVAVGVREYRVGLRGMRHILLNAKVMDAQIEMKRRREADGAEVGGAVTACPHVIELREVGNPAQMGDAAGVDHRSADVIDPLPLHQFLAIVNAVEHFPNRDGRSAVLPDQTESVLQFGGNRVLQPKQVVRFKLFAKSRRLNRRQAMVHVVQKVQVGAEFLPQPGEQLRRKIQVMFRRPLVLWWRVLLGRFIGSAAVAYSIGTGQSGYSRLRPNRLVASFPVDRNGLYGLLNVGPAGMPVDQDRLARGTAQKLVQRRVQRFSLDIPERGIDRGDRRHGDRPAAPIPPFIEVLPGVLNAPGVASDQQRDEVIAQIAGYREFASIQGGIAKAGYTFLGGDFQRDKISARATNNHLCVRDSHGLLLRLLRQDFTTVASACLRSCRKLCGAIVPEKAGTKRYPRREKSMARVSSRIFGRIATFAVLVVASFTACSNALGLGQEQYVSTKAVTNGFALVKDQHAAQLYVDASDYAGVLRAVGDLREDLRRVTDCTATIVHETHSLGANPMLVGTLGKSALIDQLVREGKIDVRGIVGQWESFTVQTLRNPMPGVASALAIVGSDKRGTIYGVYDLSEQIGVSPWYWWADVPVHRHDALIVKAGRYTQGPPAVKYRGIFLNDEAPSLSGWVKERYGNYNHGFYEKVFELILRLKGNYLWPAMWNNAFREDDALNAQLADEYGIVMGISHHEPMTRAQQEWKRHGVGPWDYAKNGPFLREFWEQGLERSKDYENIITIGMRGDGDMPMSDSANIALLEQIVTDQRKIISNVYHQHADSVPQDWALYKEVQEYYEKGMRVPDDVTLLWCDDNWGNIRRLPTPEERQRGGGAGIYYHFDYVGDPRSYKWINTNPIAKVWEQMNLALHYGADRIWMVNVGDLKPMEFPIEFFSKLGLGSLEVAEGKHCRLRPSVGHARIRPAARVGYCRDRGQVHEVQRQAQAGAS